MIRGLGVTKQAASQLIDTLGPAGLSHPESESRRPASDDDRAHRAGSGRRRPPCVRGKGDRCRTGRHADRGRNGRACVPAWWHWAGSRSRAQEATNDAATDLDGAPPRLRFYVRSQLAPDRMGGHPGRLRVRRTRDRSAGPRLVPPRRRSARTMPTWRRRSSPLCPPPVRSLRSDFLRGPISCCAWPSHTLHTFERIALLGLGDSVFEANDTSGFVGHVGVRDGARGRPGAPLPPAGPLHRERSQVDLGLHTPGAAAPSARRSWPH